VHLPSELPTTSVTRSRPITMARLVLSLVSAMCLGARADYTRVLAKENAIMSTVSLVTDFEFGAPKDGLIVGVELVYKFGYADCNVNTYGTNDATNWGGCGDTRFFVNVQQNGATVFPTETTDGVTIERYAADAGKDECECDVWLYDFEQFGVNDDEIAFVDEANPLTVSTADVFSIQYSEGCCGIAHGDNSGTVTADVYFLYDASSYPFPSGTARACGYNMDEDEIVMVSGSEFYAYDVASEAITASGVIPDAPVTGGNGQPFTQIGDDAIYFLSAHRLGHFDMSSLELEYPISESLFAADRNRACLAASEDGNFVFVTGGSVTADNTGEMTTFEIYDIANDELLTGPDVPVITATGRSALAHHGCAVLDNVLYVMGGDGLNSALSIDVSSPRSISASWQQLPGILQGSGTHGTRNALRGAAVGDSVYAVSGAFPGSTAQFLDRIEPSTGEAYALSPLDSSTFSRPCVANPRDGAGVYVWDESGVVRVELESRAASASASASSAWVIELRLPALSVTTVLGALVAVLLALNICVMCANRAWPRKNAYRKVQFVDDSDASDAEDKPINA